MKDVNSPNDKVQWATDKTTNSISYKRACNTDFSSYHTLCLVVETKDHVELNDLQRKTITVTLNVISSLGTTQDFIIIIKNNICGILLE